MNQLPALRNDTVASENLTIALAQKIKNEHALAQECAETAVQHAVRCGQLLLEAKASLRHGRFVPWVEANCKFSIRTAQAYIKVAGQKRSALRFSSLRQALDSPTISGGEREMAPSNPKPPKEKKLESDPKVAEKLAEALKTIDNLAEEKSDLADTARIAEDKVQALEATEPDEQQKLIMELQKKIQRKDGEIARLTAERNRLNDKCNQLIRQVKALQKGRD